MIKIPAHQEKDPHRKNSIPSTYRRTQPIGQTPKLVLSTTGRECKRRAMCIPKDLNEIFRSHHSRCVCPVLASEESVPEMHVPTCGTLSDKNIRYHADKAKINKKVPPTDVTHLRMMSSSLVVDRDEIPAARR